MYCEVILKKRVSLGNKGETERDVVIRQWFQLLMLWDCSIMQVIVFDHSLVTTTFNL